MFFGEVKILAAILGIKTVANKRNTNQVEKKYQHSRERKKGQEEQGNRVKRDQIAKKNATTSLAFSSFNKNRECTCLTTLSNLNPGSDNRNPKDWIKTTLDKYKIEPFNFI